MINKLINYFAKKQLSSSWQEGYAKAIQERKDQAEISQHFDINHAMGKKIIFCPNEWEDPLFGTVIDVDFYNGQPNLWVRSALCPTQTFGVQLGTFYFADDQLTRAILKLNPFERWNLSCKSQHANMWSKPYEINVTLTPADELEKLLIKSGFLGELNDDATRPIKSN